MGQEKLEERVSCTLAIDYADIGKKGYIFVDGDRDFFCGNDFNELFTRFSVECGFGFAREHEYPKYELIIFDRAKPFLGEAGVKLLEAVVNYHNHVVESRVTEDNS